MIQVFKKLLEKQAARKGTKIAQGTYKAITQMPESRVGTGWLDPNVDVDDWAFVRENIPIENKFWSITHKYPAAVRKAPRIRPVPKIPREGQEVPLEEVVKKLVLENDNIHLSDRDVYSINAAILRSARKNVNLPPVSERFDIHDPTVPRRPSKWADEVWKESSEMDNFPIQGKAAESPRFLNKEEVDQIYDNLPQDIKDKISEKSMKTWIRRYFVDADIKEYYVPVVSVYTPVSKAMASAALGEAAYLGGNYLFPTETSSAVRTSAQPTPLQPTQPPQTNESVKEGIVLDTFYVTPKDITPRLGSLNNLGASNAPNDTLASYLAQELNISPANATYLANIARTNADAYGNTPERIAQSIRFYAGLTDFPFSQKLREMGVQPVASVVQTPAENTKQVDTQPVVPSPQPKINPAVMVANRIVSSIVNNPQMSLYDKLSVLRNTVNDNNASPALRSIAAQALNSLSNAFYAEVDRSAALAREQIGQTQIPYRGLDTSDLNFGVPLPAEEIIRMHSQPIPAPVRPPTMISATANAATWPFRYLINRLMAPVQ